MAKNQDQAEISEPTPAETAAAASVEASAETNPVPKMSELTGIRYVGGADVKSFSKDDLEVISQAEAKEDLEWSSDNGFVVSVSQFNAATRDALLADPDFKAV